MIIRTSIVTGLAAILLSGAAHADSATINPTTKKPMENSQRMADRCAALETQFDQAITSHGNATKAAAAKQLRTKGGDLCKANNPANGIKNLEQALKDLGVKPNA